MVERKKKKKEEVKKVAQAGAKGRIGAKPEQVVTPTGDRFDTSKPIVASDFSSRESFQQAEQIRKGSKQGFTPQGETRVQAERRAGTEARQKQLDTIAEIIGQPRQLPPEEQPPVQAQALQPPEAQQGLGGTIKDILTGESLERQAAEAGGTLQAGTAPIGVGAIGAGVKAISAGRGLSLPVTRAAQASQAAKTTIGKRLGSIRTAISSLTGKATKGLIGAGLGIFGVSKILSFGDKRIRSADTALSQIRETIAAYPTSVRNGALSPAEANDGLDDLEIELARLEASIQTAAAYSVEARTNPEFLSQSKIRVIKLKAFILAARQDVLLAAASPQPENQEALALLLEELKGGG